MEQDIEIKLELTPRAAFEALPRDRRDAARRIMEQAVAQIRAALADDAFARQVLGR